MAQESKAIDLGKLQNELNAARAKRRSTSAVLKAAISNMAAARRRVEAADLANAESNKLVDKAEQAMLDGARSVAQG